MSWRFDNTVVGATFRYWPITPVACGLGLLKYELTISEDSSVMIGIQVMATVFSKDSDSTFLFAYNKNRTAKLGA